MAGCIETFDGAYSFPINKQGPAERSMGGSGARLSRIAEESPKARRRLPWVIAEFLPRRAEWRQNHPLTLAGTWLMGNQFLFG
ncbi:hypothetical protein [Methylomonas albis]|nr:hypothetical protein [Methylomonas albis]